jgi:hypothetical protein
MGKPDPAKIEAAKAELDKVMTDPKAATNMETYLLQAEIMGAIAGDSSLKAKYPNAGSEAFDALKKYLQAEPSGAKYKADNFAGINNMIQSFATAGAKNFSTKSWDSAFVNYKNLVELSDTLISKGWSNSKFDTISNFYAGAAAQNAKRDDDAAHYYARLANQKVGDKDYEFLYQYLVDYYTKKKDAVNFEKYISLAKSIYPQNKIWNQFEDIYMQDNLTAEEMAKKFDEGNTAKTLNASQYTSFGEYFINDKKIKELAPAKKDEYINRSFLAFTKAYELEPTNGLLANNAGVAAFNMFEEKSETRFAIKGTTPAIKAKQAEADKIVDVAADKAIEWLEKGYKTIDAKADKTNTDKNSAKSSAKLLSILYDYKKQRSKGKAAEYDKYDAKFKFYDTKY